MSEQKYYMKRKMKRNKSSAYMCACAHGVWIIISCLRYYCDRAGCVLVSVRGGDQFAVARSIYYKCDERLSVHDAAVNFLLEVV